MAPTATSQPTSLRDRARSTSTTARTETVPEFERDHSAVLIPIDQLVRYAANARTNFPPEEIEQLAEGIREHGLLQALTVRETPVKRLNKPLYEVIAGERRFLACQKAGLLLVPCKIRQANDSEAKSLNLIENIQRKDLNPTEKGAGLQALQREMQRVIDDYMLKEFGPEDKRPYRFVMSPSMLDQMLAHFLPAPQWMKDVVENAKEKGRNPIVTNEIVAKRVGLTTRYMERLMGTADVVESLGEPDDETKTDVMKGVQDELQDALEHAIEDGKVTERHLRAIKTLDDRSQRRKLTRKILDKGLTSDAAMNEAKRLKSTSTTTRLVETALVTPSMRVSYLKELDQMVSKLGYLRDNDPRRELPDGFKADVRKRVELMLLNLGDQKPEEFEDE